jgi:outer membrane protein assembly factor BamA
MKKTKNVLRFVLTALLFTAPLMNTMGQNKHVTLKDSLDGALDMSDYIIYAHGFIIVPTVITEPALGGIGGAILPIFLKKNDPVIDENGQKRTINPDITGGIGMYTANKSWLAGGFRSGSLIKSRITYRVMAMYGDLNLSFYETLAKDIDTEFKFNFESTIFYTQVLKQFKNAKWSAGPQYLLLDSNIKLRDDDLPSYITEKKSKSFVSQLGGAIQFDNRDNIFTPDKGVRLDSDFFWSDNAIGSDYNTWRINLSTIGYYPITKKLIGGLRFEGQQTLGDTPFYLLPSIDLRGIPSGRYQGSATMVAETEFRWDLYKRWSLMAYGGGATAFDKWDQAFKKPLIYSCGTGFRYLIARKFKLRMGVDIARGPEDWAYYIVFGSNWFR